jgi:hypothetical protein
MQSELDILKETIEIKITELNELIEEFKIKLKKNKGKLIIKIIIIKLKNNR